MKIKCPKCDSEDIKIIGDHYFCNYCFAEFQIVFDLKKEFPYNCIFPNRPVSSFYRMPYYNYDK